MEKITNFDSLMKAVADRYTQLEEVDKYLSDAGKAAKEAYHITLWNLGFHTNIESLSTDEEFERLVNTPGKHPEYYRVLRMIYRCIERLTKEG